MSTTIPSAPSSPRRNSRSTTYVAPCRLWAGPKTSPRRLWAIIMWPRTVTLYISNPVAKRFARRRGQLFHHVRQVVECALARDERVERRIPQQIERERHAPSHVPPRALRR